MWRNPMISVPADGEAKASGVKALSMNFAALGLDPAAPRPEDSSMQAKGDLEARSTSRALPTELYSLSNWYKIPVRPKWLGTIWLVANSKNHVSSDQVSRDLGVTQKRASFMLQR